MLFVALVQEGSKYVLLPGDPLAMLLKIVVLNRVGSWLTSAIY